MDNRRSPLRIHQHCLIWLLALSSAAACADTLPTEQNVMTTFPSRTAQLEAALNPSTFAPSASLGRLMVFDKSDFHSLFGDDITISSFHKLRDGPDATVSIFAVKDEKLVISVEITQVAGKDRMIHRLEGGFDMISAPLDGIQAVDISGTDIVVRLSAGDTYAIASRGDIFVQVSTGSGIAASAAAARMLDAVFKAR